MRQERGSARLRDAPRHPNGTIVTRVVTFQRQTYAPFTRTRTQAVPAAAAPTAAPPTTARRVVRRATPATLTGVAGRPTLASALWMDSARPPLCGKSIEANIPKPRTATASSIRFALNVFIATSLGG